MFPVDLLSTLEQMEMRKEKGDEVSVQIKGQFNLFEQKVGFRGAHGILSQLAWQTAMSFSLA